MHRFTFLTTDTDIWGLVSADTDVKRNINVTGSVSANRNIKSNVGLNTINNKNWAEKEKITNIFTNLVGRYSK